MKQEYNEIGDKIFNHWNRNNMENKVLMVDIEDTLSNADHRRHLSPHSRGIKHPEPANWDDWNEAFTDDPPTDIVPIIRELSEKYEIIISTAKPEKYRSDVKAWLKVHLGFIPTQICMRREVDKYLSSPQLKKIHRDFISEQRWTDTGMLKFKIECVIDDRIDVCHMDSEMEVSFWHYNKDKEVFSDIPAFLANELKDTLRFPKEPTIQKTPESILLNVSTLHKNRNKKYGNAYKTFGSLLSLFPNGIHLETEEDLNRWGVLNILLSKVQRYCANFDKGGHSDSLDDMISYAAMLQELDSLIKSNT